jgi:hypothetical protein
MFEQPPQKEFSERERELIEKLAKVTEAEFKGSDAEQALVRWEEEEDREGPKDSQQRLEHIFRLGEIYYAAGHRDAAWETFLDVRDGAQSDPDALDIYRKAKEALGLPE